MNLNLNSIDMKLLYFEYIQNRMLEWYAQYGDVQKNDLSILKSLKLLFFVSASKAAKSSPNKLLDEVFTRFVAMPFGHVESDILNEIKKRKGFLNYFTIDNQSTVESEKFDVGNGLLANLDKDILLEIDESVSNLKEKNHKMITMSAFDLVTLSHTWYSWQHNFKNAESSGNRSHAITPEEIKSEDKIFSISVY